MFRIIKKTSFLDKEIGTIIKRNYSINTEDAICDTLVKQSNELKDIRIKIDNIIYELHKIDRRLINNEYISKELLTSNLHIVSRLNTHNDSIKKFDKYINNKTPNITLTVYDKP